MISKKPAIWTSAMHTRSRELIVSLHLHRLIGIHMNVSTRSYTGKALTPFSIQITIRGFISNSQRIVASSSEKFYGTLSRYTSYLVNISNSEVKTHCQHLVSSRNYKFHKNRISPCQNSIEKLRLTVNPETHTHSRLIFEITILYNIYTLTLFTKTIILLSSSSFASSEPTWNYQKSKLEVSRPYICPIEERNLQVSSPLHHISSVQIQTKNIAIIKVNKTITTHITSTSPNHFQIYKSENANSIVVASHVPVSYIPGFNLDEFYKSAKEIIIYNSIGQPSVYLTLPFPHTVLFNNSMSISDICEEQLLQSDIEEFDLNETFVQLHRYISLESSLNRISENLNHLQVISSSGKRGRSPQKQALRRTSQKGHARHSKCSH